MVSEVNNSRKGTCFESERSRVRQVKNHLSFPKRISFLKVKVFEMVTELWPRTSFIVKLGLRYVQS